MRPCFRRLGWPAAGLAIIAADGSTAPIVPQTPTHVQYRQNCSQKAPGLLSTSQLSQTGRRERWLEMGASALLGHESNGQVRRPELGVRHLPEVLGLLCGRSVVDCADLYAELPRGGYERPHIPYLEDVRTARVATTAAPKVPWGHLPYPCQFRKGECDTTSDLPGSRRPAPGRPGDRSPTRAPSP